MESHSTFRLPPLHPTTFWGDTMNSMERRSSELGGNEWAINVLKLVSNGSSFCIACLLRFLNYPFVVRSCSVIVLQSSESFVNILWLSDIFLPVIVAELVVIVPHRPLMWFETYNRRELVLLSVLHRSLNSSRRKPFLKGDAHVIRLVALRPSPAWHVGVTEDFKNI